MKLALLLAPFRLSPFCRERALSPLVAGGRESWGDPGPRRGQQGGTAEALSPACQDSMPRFCARMHVFCSLDMGLQLWPQPQAAPQPRPHHLCMPGRAACGQPSSVTKEQPHSLQVSSGPGSLCILTTTPPSCARHDPSQVSDENTEARRG